MELPDWADATLSRDLPVLRSRGESQDLEYKSEFPSNARDLGKEIAAFASTNTGTILLGVADSGELVGLHECDTSEGRDQIIRRLEGVSKGTVKPSITPTVKFAVENGKVVLVIIVPKGSQPIYYSSNTPYVRHLTQSSPAEPHEVVERVAKYLRENLASTTDDEVDKKSQFYTDLARVLADVLAVVDEADERQVNPWLDMWRSEFSYAATELRDMAVSSFVDSEALVSGLHELADKLDDVANMKLYLGSGADLLKGVEEVGVIAQTIMDNNIGNMALSEESLDQVRELIRATALKLKDLHARSATMVEAGRIEELQSQASEFARPLTRASYYNIDVLGDGIKQELNRIARTLHLTETMRLYMDGGRSENAVIDRIDECATQLTLISERV
ncbi:MAG: ATP-binding protein [Candidatus Thiodiazotropha sp. (ex Monitilora ramsayi)]|nr:ATP-binding protein [Candidatus Thiodiazotropha sp. (ex Monitilora ramsayi)]